MDQEIQNYLKMSPEDRMALLGAVDLSLTEREIGPALILERAKPSVADELEREGLLPDLSKLTPSALAERGRKALSRILETYGTRLTEAICPQYRQMQASKETTKLGVPITTGLVATALAGTPWAAFAALVGACIVDYGLDKLCVEYPEVENG